MLDGKVIEPLRPQEHSAPAATTAGQPLPCHWASRRHPGQSVSLAALAPFCQSVTVAPATGQRVCLARPPACPPARAFAPLRRHPTPARPLARRPPFSFKRRSPSLHPPTLILSFVTR